MKDRTLSKNRAFRDWVSIIGFAVAVGFPHPYRTAAQATVDLGSASHLPSWRRARSERPYVCHHGRCGLSPAARSNITGLLADEVVGTMFAADDGSTVAIMLTAAQGDLTTAYNDAAGRSPVPTGPFLDPGSGNLGGLNLVPGLYKFTGAALISGSDLTLTGSASDVWVFQIGSSLDVANGIHLVLAGGAQASNIYWQVGTAATLGTGVIFKGNILANQSIALMTLATLDGRALARIAAVTLDSNAITVPNSATSVILQSAALPTGPYADAPGQSLNLAAKTITAPLSDRPQFYRIRAGTALAIKIVGVSGGNAVITYN